jgi:hypothetical protein
MPVSWEPMRAGEAGTGALLLLRRAQEVLTRSSEQATRSVSTAFPRIAKSKTIVDRNDLEFHPLHAKHFFLDFIYERLYI